MAERETDMNDRPSTSQRARGGRRPGNTRLRAILLGVLAVAVIVIAIVLITGGGDDNNGGGAVPPTLASGEDLTNLANETNHSVYWAGEQPGTRTEFERDSDGNVYVRYLPQTGNPASERNSSLTVGSYPVGDAVAGLEVVAKRPGANTYKLQSVPGALVVNNDSKPSSVYVAFPGSAVQVEVYDPNPADALKAVLSGEIVPLR
jgi:hypothetical protein